MEIEPLETAREATLFLPSPSLWTSSGQIPVIPHMTRADVKAAMLYDLCHPGTGTKRLYMYSNILGREHANPEGIV